MTTIQPPREEAQRLIRLHMTSRGSQPSNLVLVAPSLDEVKAAIAAGVDGEVTVCLVKRVQFKDAIAGKNRATIQSVMEYETVTLRRIKYLQEGPDGEFGFVGAVRSYDDEAFHEHNGRSVRSYSEDRYRVSFDPHLNVPTTYMSAGSGQGTEFEGEES